MLNSRERYKHNKYVGSKNPSRARFGFPGKNKGNGNNRSILQSDDNTHRWINRTRSVDDLILIFRGLAELVEQVQRVFRMGIRFGVRLQHIDGLSASDPGSG